MTRGGVQIEWIGHACFRIVTNSSRSIVTDPYDPEELTLPTFQMTADYVIASSLTDPAHSAVELVGGSPTIIDALHNQHSTTEFELVTAKKRESPLHPDGARDNAMYAFQVGGLWILHMGDTGEALTEDDYEVFSGKCDVLLALVGGGLTISLPELDVAIDRLAPKWVIPMHYALPGMGVTLLPVNEFLGRRANDAILLMRGTTVTLDESSTPYTRPTIVVLSAASITGPELQGADGVSFADGAPP